MIPFALSFDWTINFPVILTFVGQTFVIIWVMAQLFSRVKSIETRLDSQQIQMDVQKTQVSSLLVAIGILNTEVTNIKKTAERLEVKIDKLIERP